MKIIKIKKKEEENYLFFKTDTNDEQLKINIHVTYS